MAGFHMVYGDHEEHNAVTNNLRELELSSEDVAAAGEDRQYWLERMAQCIVDIIIIIVFYPL